MWWLFDTTCNSGCVKKSRRSVRKSLWYSWFVILDVFNHVLTKFKFIKLDGFQLIWRLNYHTRFWSMLYTLMSKCHWMQWIPQNHCLYHIFIYFCFIIWYLWFHLLWLFSHFMWHTIILRKTILEQIIRLFKHLILFVY